MSDYTGKECLVCGREFDEKDDIVVCPECGTPYHRECYLEKGECINYELHESGVSWQEQQRAQQQRRIDSGEIIKCPRCGGENPGEALFCNYCGLPLGVKSSDGAQQSFNDHRSPDDGERGGSPEMNGYPGYGPMMGMQTQRLTPESDIDGNTLGEYASYVRTNRGYFITQFIRFSRFAKKASFSFMAFLFPEFYFFYRKMFKAGILAFLIMFLTSMPSLIVMFHESSDYIKTLGASSYSALINDINLSAGWFNAFYNICYFGSWALQIVCGVFANFWYYKKAKGDIEKIKSSGGESGAIALKGGTSFGMMFISFMIYMTVSILFLVAVHYRADILAMIR